MKKIFILIIALIGLSSNAQDAIFSQNFLVPETLSSSFTGALKSFKMGSIYRTQWRNFSLKTNTNYAYFDTWFEGIKTGFGVSLMNSTENGSNYRYTQVNFNYARPFQLSDTWYFTPSISAGIGMKNYGFQNLLLEDQINVNTGVINPVTADPLALRETTNFIDISSSVLFSNEESWIGFTLKHLNRPNISLNQNGNIPLDIFLSVHAKYYVPLLENMYSKLARRSKLYVLTNYMHQGKTNRLDIGAQYLYDDIFTIGILAATSPNQTNASTETFMSISTFAGIKWEGFRFGYSYDINRESLGLTGGIHEFSISYDFLVNTRYLNRFKCISYF